LAVTQPGTSAPAVDLVERERIKCRALHNMAMVHDLLGDTTRARQLFTAAVDLAVAVKDFTMQISGRLALGALFLAQSDGSGALAAYAAAACTAKSVSDTPSTIEALAGSGDVYLQQLAPGKARVVFRRAYRMAVAMKPVAKPEAATARRRAATGVKRTRKLLRVLAKVALLQQQRDSAAVAQR
jgi:hypothetical protein